MKSRTTVVEAVSRAAAIIITLASPLALAHEGHDHAAEESSLKGTVESVTGHELTLKAVDGKRVKVHIDNQTRYDNGASGGSVSDLHPGLRVVVNGEKMKDGTLHAAAIRYASSKHETGGHHAHEQARAAH